MYGFNTTRWTVRGREAGLQAHLTSVLSILIYRGILKPKPLPEQSILESNCAFEFDNLTSEIKNAF
jgi:hypothetical protein